MRNKFSWLKNTFKTIVSFGTNCKYLFIINFLRAFIIIGSFDRLI